MNFISRIGSVYFLFIYLFILVYIKMSEIADLTYYQKCKGLMLNKAKDLYKNNKERLREQTRDKYRSLSEEKKK